MERVKVTAADFNGRDWDGSPFDPAPAPEWLQLAIKIGDITVSNGSHCTDYAVWDVRGAGEAWPGDYIVHGGGRLYTIEKAQASTRSATERDATVSGQGDKP